MTDIEQKNKNHYWFFIIAALLILLDQLTKFAVKGFPFWGINYQGMSLGQSFRVFGDFLTITFVENEGMAFGISFGAGKIFLSLFSIIAGAALGYYLYRIREYSAWVRLGIMLIFVGAVGNLIDRVFYGIIYGTTPLFYGRVVDFVMVDIPDITILGQRYTHFPVFNVADSCVTVGVIILLLFYKKIPTLKEVFNRKTEIKDKE